MPDSLILLDVKCRLVPISESDGRSADMMDKLQKQSGLLPTAEWMLSRLLNEVSGATDGATHSPGNPACFRNPGSTRCSAGTMTDPQSAATCTGQTQLKKRARL